MASRSRVAELAAEEAARAESEPDDDDTDEDLDADAETPPDETDAEPDAEPDAEDVELSAEAFAAKLESVLRIHHDNLRGLFGERFEEMEACALCGGLGTTTPESPVFDPQTQRCARCKGHGLLVTESANPEHVTRQCPDCLGNGYVPRSDVPAAVPNIVAPAAYGAPPAPPAPEPVPVVVPPMPLYDAATNRWLDPQTGAPLEPAASSPNSTGLEPAVVT